MITNLLLAENSTVDCNQIFELRKQELLKEVDKIDEEAQSLDALKNANLEMFQKREKALNQKEELIIGELGRIESLKKEIENITSENKKILDDMKNIKDSKVSQSFLKMKEGKAAAILDAMSQDEAASILLKLTPKKISKVMAKMDPNNASKITNIMLQNRISNKSNITTK